MIYYHVPEDHDRSDEPNVFSMPIPQNKVQLQHIYQHFPLKGTYAFRFKIAINEFIVWLDLNDSLSTVPTFKEHIYLKATRVSWQEFKNHQSILTENRGLGKPIHKKESIDIFEHHQQPPPHKNEANQGNLGDVNLLDSGSPSNSPALHPVAS